MELWEAINGRRSVGKVKPDKVERELIDKLLEAAVMAPCHGMTEPWRFIVMTGDGRRRLGEAYARIAGTAEPSLAAEHMRKAYRAPVVIAVACSPSDRPKVVRIEEFAAVHAAVQNMLLAAHALGLGAIWRSGDPMFHPIMKETFELGEQEELVALVYIGYSETQPPAPKRKPAEALTTWLE